MLVRDKFSFLDVDIWFDVTKCEFIVKNSSSNVFGVLVYFMVDTKITFVYNFVAHLTLS